MSIDSDFLFCNVFPQETSEGSHYLEQKIRVITSFAIAAKEVLAFPNISVLRTMSTFGGGQHLSTINSVDKQLFEGFQHISGAIGFSLTDKSETPQIVSKLKEYNLIDNDLCFRILDSLLTFDGLLSQVNQDGKLLTEDFDLMRNILTLFSQLKLNLNQNYGSIEHTEYKTTGSYFGPNRTTTWNSLFYFNYLSSTFSTSSSTLKTSSNVDFMKPPG